MDPSNMPVWLGRVIMVALGAAFLFGAVSMTMPAIKRGYFEGKRGAIFRRGEAMYYTHCGLNLLVMGVGLGFIGAGLFLPGDQLLRRQR